MTQTDNQEKPIKDINGWEGCFQRELATINDDLNQRVLVGRAHEFERRKSERALYTSLTGLNSKNGTKKDDNIANASVDKSQDQAAVSDDLPTTTRDEEDAKPGAAKEVSAQKGVEHTESQTENDDGAASDARNAAATEMSGLKVENSPTKANTEAENKEQKELQELKEKVEAEFVSYDFPDKVGALPRDYQKTPQNVGHHYLTGICLSGGGVRSAVISLGILNKLEQRGMLEHFDYLTSVSGGGYAGSALSHWKKLQERGVSNDLFAAQYLDFVRRNVSYLMPGGSSGFFTGLFVVLRAILMNLFIWVTIGAAFLAAAMMIFYIFPLTFIAQSQNAIARTMVALTSWSGMEWSTPSDGVFLIFLLLACILLLLIAFMMLFFSISSYFVRSSLVTADEPPRKRTDDEPLMWRILQSLNNAITSTVHFFAKYAFFAEPTKLGLSLLSRVLGITRIYTTSPDISAKYLRRRWFEANGGRLLRLFVAAAVIGTLPVVAENLGRILVFLDKDADPKGGLVGTVFTLIGIGSAAATYYNEKVSDQLRSSQSILIIAGSGFFVYGVALLAYFIAVGYWLGACGLPDCVGVGSMCCASYWPVALMTAILMAAILLALLVNVNDVSLGRFYRDRLMETFLPDQETIEEFETTTNTVPAPATIADTGLLKTLSKQRPLHLVCANVLPTWVGDRKAKERLGDSFVLSRIYCGSDITGFRSTENVAKGNLRLSTAMAASGAAANPRGGFTGKGATASTPTAVAMALLALRLGYWLAWDKPSTRRRFNPYGNHFSPSFMSTMSHVFRTDRFAKRSGFIEVTDGGHFENLGLYELIRRRCGLIVICDGGSDREASYDSFTAATHRIEEDFGAKICFDVEIDNFGQQATQTDMRRSGPENIVSRPDDKQFPKGTHYADRGFFLARIKYEQKGMPPEQASNNDYTAIDDGRRYHTRGPTEGLLIYLKSAMLRELDHKTKGYRGANPEFPFDSTANQFFTPEQFDAYFNVGETLVDQMLDQTSLDKLFTQGAQRPTLSRLLMNHFFQTQGPRRDA